VSVEHFGASMSEVHVAMNIGGAMLWFVCPKTICSPFFPQHLSTLIKRGLRVGHPILRRQNRMDNTGERGSSNGAQYKWPAEMVMTYSPTYVHTIQTKFNVEHTRVGVTHALLIKLLLHISTGRRASTWWGIMTLHIYTVHCMDGELQTQRIDVL